MVFFYLHRGKYQLIEAGKRWYLCRGEKSTQKRFCGLHSDPRGEAGEQLCYSVCIVQTFRLSVDRLTPAPLQALQWLALTIHLTQSL